jgi:putative PEP-CTERM system histidine kinase
VDLALYGYAIAALLHTALALGLWRDATFETGIGARPALAAVAATAAWAWFALASRIATGPFAALAASAFDLLRYVLWFVCLLALLKAAAQARPFAGATLLRRSAPLLLVAVLALWFARLVGGASGGLLDRMTFAGALALPVFGMLLVEQFYRNIAEDTRWNAKPLCLALGLLFAFDIYFFSQAALFGQFSADSINVRGAVHGFCVPLLWVAARRQANRTSNLRISRTAAFQTATLLLVGVYLLFISSIGYYVRRFGGDWGSALQLALLFLALVALVIMLSSRALRAKLRVFVGKNFFTYRFDYRTEWLRFTAMLSPSAAPNDVGTAVIRGLADLVESRGSAIWFKVSSDTEFVATATWNMPRLAHREPIDSPLCTFLDDKGWIIDVDECRSFPQRYGGLQMPEWLLSLPSCWLIVPLHVGDELTGFAVLAHARVPMAIDWEVRDLLKTASRQAAGFLAHMHATEALLEARKFEAFNHMSAFVVHDLKNIVTQLSLLLKNAKRLHANPEFQQDMLVTIENSLEKMRQLMLQLRDGKPNPRGTAGVDLVPLSRRLGASNAQRGRPIELSLPDSVVTRGEEDRIERVLGHVLQNAIEATSSTDRVWMEVHRASGQAKVVIGDTGRGMAQEFVNTRLFKPFSTTKEGGMGIGAYESFQYLKELGGSISVDSEVDRGTIVTILLPLLETQPNPDLEVMANR